MLVKVWDGKGHSDEVAEQKEKTGPLLLKNGKELGYPGSCSSSVL